jgi:hypothetical protein
MKNKKMFVMFVMSLFLLSSSIYAQDAKTNTKFGTNAGQSCSGEFNSFFGYQAGQNSGKCSNNTFLGMSAGSSTTTGGDNTFLGAWAGEKNIEGNGNTFLGTCSGKNSTIGQDNTFLGAWAGWSNTTGKNNIFVGREAGHSNTEGQDNTFVGYKSGHNSVGSGNVFIGNKAGYNESGSDKLYIANGPNPDNVLIYGDFSNVKVGIGKTDPSYTLDVNGTIKGESTVTPSDIRLKKDIKPIMNALDNIAQLRGITFRWKDNEKDTGVHLGVIAQEVEEVFPEVVSTDNKGYKSVDYSKLTAPLIEAVKELKAENEALKARIEALEQRSAIKKGG